MQFYSCFLISFPSTVTFFTEVKFCFLASSPSRIGGAVYNFRPCSTCNIESLVNFLLKDLASTGQKCLFQSNGDFL